MPVIPTPPPQEYQSDANTGDLTSFEGGEVPDYLPTDDSGGVGSFPGSNLPGLTVLEQVAGIACKNVPYLVGKNEVSKAAVFFKPRCKSWHCAACAKTNADLWQMRATVGADHFIQQGFTVQLVTVTSHERVSRKVAIERLPDNWNRLRNRWQREVGKPAYFIVGETGNKSAHFHLHLITNLSPGERFWKDAARASGMGYIADESDPLVNASRAGFYCGKYLAKQFSAGLYKKGYRRVRCSNSWPKLPKLPRDPNWDFSVVANGEPLSGFIEKLQAQGFRVALADYRSAWSVVDAC